MRKTEKIKPPRKPRGENRAVTIANQDLQIRNLIARIEYLERLNNDFAASNRVKDEALNQLGKVAEQLANMQKAHTRMQGWQDCAREMIVVRE